VQGLGKMRGRKSGGSGRGCEPDCSVFTGRPEARRPWRRRWRE
jgi:hypothetical protein